MPAKERAARYASILRVQDILVLQGTPLLGALFAVGHPEAHDLGRLALLLAGNLLLVTHVFLLNDWANLTADLADPRKADTVFTTRGVGTKEIGGLIAALLMASILLFICLSVVTAAISLTIALFSALYSLPRFNWKGKPLLNSAAHLGGGIAHFLLGYSLGGSVDGRGVAVGTFFALLFAAGHLTQEIRDFDGDSRNGVATNAVIFGQRRTFAASLALFALAHIVFLLLVLRGILPGILVAVIFLYPLQLYWSFGTLRQGFTFDTVSRLQRRYRTLYAIVGVVMIVVLFTAALRAPVPSPAEARKGAAFRPDPTAATTVRSVIP